MHEREYYGLRLIQVQHIRISKTLRHMTHW